MRGSSASFSSFGAGFSPVKCSRKEHLPPASRMSVISMPPGMSGGMRAAGSVFIVNASPVWKYASGLSPAALKKGSPRR